jgi:hypothetical protein
MARPDVNENITLDERLDKACEIPPIRARGRIAPSPVATTGVYAVAPGRGVEDAEVGCARPRRDP